VFSSWALLTPVRIRAAPPFFALWELKLRLFCAFLLFFVSFCNLVLLSVILVLLFGVVPCCLGFWVLLAEAGDDCPQCFNGFGKTYVWGFELPLVQVSVWAGMSGENKRKVVEGITRVFEELGIPREAVTVVIYEAPKTNWATGGQLHSEKFANR